MRKAKYTVLFVIMAVMLMLSGCKKKKEVEPTPLPTPIHTPIEATPTPTPEIPVEEIQPTPESREGQVLSKLTGTWVSEKVGNRRPYAVMINNTDYAASFHNGISQASIIYEAMVEGYITRMMAIFERFNSKKIGSVRSARHYFVSFADEYDAILVHYGQTKYAIAKMKELGTNNLNGIEGIGSTVFYRDNNYRAPHNAFASYKGIMAGVKSKDYRKKYKTGYEGHYKFNEQDTDLESKKEAKKVTLKYSSIAAPYFVYHEGNKSYNRYSYGQKHKDLSNNKQLSFKNLIIQYVKEWDIDRNGYQTMDLADAKGDGWYITNGKAIKITWKKNEKNSNMRYYNKNGDELTINPGKTYIGVFPNNRTKDVIISKTVKKKTNE